MKIIIADAGARYGVFPLFNDLKDFADYHMFELDQREALRLKSKYASNSNIMIHDFGLYSKYTKKKAFISAHHGLTSLYQANDQSVSDKKHFCDEIKEIKTQSIMLKRLDDVLSEVDYLKIDTEGSELDVLKGSVQLLSQSIIGIRAEVNFIRIRKNMPLFDEILSFLRDKDFELVNLDYHGKGTAQSKFINPLRYGSLVSSDAVWIRNEKTIFKNNGADGIIKAALFLMLNNAEDVAIALLQKYVNNKLISLSNYQNDKIVEVLDLLIQKHFKCISASPYFSFKELNSVYKSIFQKSLKKWHQYYETL